MKFLRHGAVIRVWISLILAVLSVSQSSANETDALAGKIWDVQEQKIISFRSMLEVISNKTYILLGESHGKETHQNREAFIIAALAEFGRFPTLALEMLTHEQTQIVEKYREKSPEYSLGLAIPLGWPDSNWPSWDFYQPIFDVAFVAKLPIVGADFTDAEKREMRKQGGQNAQSHDARVNYYLQRLQDVHCGLVDDEQSLELAHLQVARDKHMAQVLQKQRHPDEGAFLIAGITHVRKGSGVPVHLPDSDFVAVAMMGTQSRLSEFQQAPNKELEDNMESFDFVWFTPGKKKRSNCN